LLAGVELGAQPGGLVARDALGRQRKFSLPLGALGALTQPPELSQEPSAGFVQLLDDKL
jgi:hypothetical protein